jgi:hypothetical protein
MVIAICRIPGRPQLAGTFQRDTSEREKMPQPRGNFGVLEETSQFAEFPRFVDVRHPG